MAEVPKAGQYVRMTVTNVNAPRSVTRNVNTVRSFPVMGLHPNDRGVVMFEVLPQVLPSLENSLLTEELEVGMDNQDSRRLVQEMSRRRANNAQERATSSSYREQCDILTLIRQAPIYP